MFHELSNIIKNGFFLSCGKLKLQDLGFLKGLKTPETNKFVLLNNMPCLLKHVYRLSASMNAAFLLPQKRTSWPSINGFVPICLGNVSNPYYYFLSDFAIFSSPDWALVPHFLQIEPMFRISCGLRFSQFLVQLSKHYGLSWGFLATFVTFFGTKLSGDIDLIRIYYTLGWISRCQ